jgi:sigma-B regulation protein RsbU (phosphoserine phosphatase)
MAIGETAYVNNVREQLLAGRARLSEVLAGGEREHVDRLLNQVDEALQRIEQGTFGICEECHTPIGEDWLREDPLTTVCLEHMTPKQQRALEYDLELAAQIQKGLLPPCDTAFAGWDISYHYQPAGVVGGDYCDVVREDGHLYFILADVSGKGVAAAMLSSNLRAIFRALIPLGLCPEDLVARANRLFRQSALPTQYATLVCGKVTADGELEMVNAGHLPVLLCDGSSTRLFESTNPPVGVFDGQQFTGSKDRLNAGDELILFTDGISEAENHRGDEYGLDRLRGLIQQHHSGCPVQLVDAFRQQFDGFRDGGERLDDETLLVMQYVPAAGHAIAPETAVA